MHHFPSDMTVIRNVKTSLQHVVTDTEIIYWYVTSSSFAIAYLQVIYFVFE